MFNFNEMLHRRIYYFKIQKKAMNPFTFPLNFQNPLLNTISQIPPITVSLPQENKIPDNTEFEKTYKLLKQTNRELEERKEKLERENRDLKRMIKPKRFYSKRRSDMKKQFKCGIQGCEKQYSSNVALNSHIRKKHLID